MTELKRKGCVDILKVGMSTLATSSDTTDPACRSEMSWLTKYSFATEGVGLATVAFIGVLANLLSITVLSHKTMKTQISMLLTTLAIFDILFLLCTFPLFTIQSIMEFANYLNNCVYQGQFNRHFLKAFSASFKDVLI